MRFRQHARRRIVGGLAAGAVAAALASVPSPTQAVQATMPTARPSADHKPGYPSLARRDRTADRPAVSRTAAVRTTGGSYLRSTAALELSPCADDPAFLCGTLPVPLNRKHPDGRTIPLHVEVLPHSGPAANPAGAVFVTEGGPGFSVSLFAKYDYPFLLGDVTATRDLVFVDQRGVGLSAAIDCPDWQHGGPFYSSARKCHDQLGDTANFYSTVDVADDLEQVRRALGYGTIDLLGGSYAGADMLTYAVRHSQHVRTVSLGSPSVTAGTDPFNHYPAAAFPALVDSLCGRSPACAAATPDPAGELAWLAARLRRSPVTGTGVSSQGIARRVTVTESLLAHAVMTAEGAGWVGPGEIVQASRALRRGDAVPLLRLGADLDPGTGVDYGDPREFSAGHLLARLCTDLPVQWDKDAPLSRRVAQYAAAYRAAPAFFGPISKAGWASPDLLGWQPRPCITSSWQDRPNYPVGTTVRGVPALVFGGEYDTIVPESVSQLATRVLVGAEYVSLAGSGHVPWFFSSCAGELLQRFIVTRDAGDTSCAAVPPFGAWQPGSFPRSVADAPPARQTSGPAASGWERRLATVVAWTTLDGLRHNAFVPVPISAGLRGGTITFDRENPVPTFTFDRARFTGDAHVSGPVIWTGTVDGDLTVVGPHERSYTARIEGTFLRPGEDLTITLRHGDRSLAFAVPGY